MKGKHVDFKGLLLCQPHCIDTSSTFVYALNENSASGMLLKQNSVHNAACIQADTLQNGVRLNQRRRIVE